MDVDTYLSQVYDSLPYIDADFNDDPKLKAVVTSLIMDSIQKSKIRFKDFQQCTEQRYPVSNFSSTTFFSQDLAQMTTSKLPERIDHTLKYNLKDVTIAPNADDYTIEQWKDVIDQFSISLEHHAKHQIHLELLRRYGKNAWQTSLQQDNQLLERISKAGDLIEQHNEYTNTSRRLRQTQLESQFQDVQNESIDLAVQNFSLATDLYLDSQRQWKKQRQE